MTEAELQEQVRLMCAQLGLYHYHPHDSRRSQKGWPDSAIVTPGRIAFRELKSTSGQLTSEQRQFGYLVQAHPGPWTVDWACWRPADLIGGHVGQFLSRMRNGTVQAHCQCEHPDTWFDPKCRCCAGLHPAPEVPR